MEYHFRKQFHQAENNIHEIVMYINNFCTYFKDDLLKEGLNKKFTHVYKNYVIKIMKEKKSIFDAQMDNYTNENEIQKAKLEYKSMMQYAESLLKQEYKWI